MSSDFATVGGYPYKVISKDPNATLDYHVILSAWLGANALASAAWDVEAGLTLVSSSINSGSVTIDGTAYAANTVATAWLSGGTVGVTYKVRCRFTDNNSPTARIDDRTFAVRVIER